jgi:two-component system, NarL family, nitrate/nitrite response regulator NarL
MMTKNILSSETELETLKVLLIDDHMMICEMLQTSFAQKTGFKVDAVSDVDSGLAAIAANGGYDVVLLDYDVPGMKGMLGLRQLVEANNGHVALFSGLADWETVERGLENGSSGYFCKSLSLKVLEYGIRLIADDQMFLPARFARKIYRDKEETELGLKPNEWRVLELLGDGLQNKAIGAKLDIEEVTVKSYVRALCHKLRVKNRTQIVIAARKQGLL